jgi:hypothetical protein
MIDPRPPIQSSSSASAGLGLDEGGLTPAKFVAGDRDRDKLERTTGDEDGGQRQLYFLVAGFYLGRTLAPVR